MEKSQAVRSIAPELYDTELAAQYICVTAGTLEVWRSTKRYPLPYIKVGRKVYYRRSDLDDFLRARTVGGAALQAA